jgi:hypothetical protein
LFQRSLPLLAFMHIEKTGGTTVHDIMLHNFGFAHRRVEPWAHPAAAYFSKQDYARTRLIYPLLRSITGHRVRPCGDLQEAGNVQFHTMLRNPLTRCASHYQYRADRMGCDLPFEEWIRTDKYRNVQVKMFAGCEDPDAAIEKIETLDIMVGLMEQFDESLGQLREWLHTQYQYVLDISYTPRNVSKRNTKKKELLNDPLAIEQMMEANQLDTQLYEYIVDQRFPAQQQRFVPRAALPAGQSAYREEANSVTLKQRAYGLQEHLYLSVLNAYRHLNSSSQGVVNEH